MNGETITSGPALSHRVLDTRWRVAGTGDFNGDGHPDIVWQHLTDGWMYVWFMDGVTRIGGDYFSIAQLKDARWRMRAVGDMNGDGHPDLVWQHPDGYLAVWLLNGLNVQGSLVLNPGSVVDTNWQIVGAADFNADGETDLLWRHATRGEVGVWMMNDLTRITFVPLTPGAVNTDWQIVAVIDADGDNTPDIVWQNMNNGQAALWFMNGTIRSRNPSISSPVPPSWRIVGAK
jgi:hypothetical protein